MPPTLTVQRVSGPGRVSERNYRIGREINRVNHKFLWRRENLHKEAYHI
jgi:hypothetical protein